MQCLGIIGIIARAQESSFRTEMASVREAVQTTMAANTAAKLIGDPEKEYDRILISKYYNYRKFHDFVSKNLT